MLTTEKIKAFLTERPLLSQRGLSLEAGISDSLLGKILNGKQSLTSKVAEKLEPILKKYGYL